MMATSTTTTDRNIARETSVAVSRLAMPVSSGQGHRPGRGETVSVPRVSQSMFLRNARMISEMPMVAMAR
jgi:hypothetical protein